MTTADQPRPETTRERWVRRAAIAGALALVGVLVFLAVRIEDGGSETGVSDAAVEQLVPAEDSLEARQTPIVVDLVPGWTGTLVVDGTEIPEDQLVRTEPLHRYSFTPGAGQAVEALTAGTVCPEAPIWRIGESRADGTTIRWCFEVF